MNDLRGKKFVASYSGGKDSMLAIYRALNAGLSPLGMITTYNTTEDRSWFHGTGEHLLQRVSASLSIPLTLIKTPAKQYEANFEEALRQAQKHGAQVCVLGDIDIESHIQWCAQRCENTGLTPYFPLWKENREKLIYEFIDSGFSAVITVVNGALMKKSFLGETLTHKTVRAIKKSGADVCGENGEYHTFVFDGPIFAEKVDFSAGQIIERDGYIILDIR